LNQVVGHGGVEVAE